MSRKFDDGDYVSGNWLAIIIKMDDSLWLGFELMDFN